MCNCCDHPLEHAILQAINAWENAVPPLKSSTVFANLRTDLDNWRRDALPSQEPAESL